MFQKVARPLLLLLALSTAANFSLAAAPGLESLRKKRDAEIAKLDPPYLVALEKLQVKFTKARNIEAALAAKAEIARVKAQVTKTEAANRFIGTWEYQSKSGQPCKRVFSDKTCTLYIDGKREWEKKYRLASPTRAVAEGLVHNLRDDGKLDIQGVYVGELAGAPPISADDPLELGVLREKRELDITKIKRFYVDALEKLKAKYAAAGDLKNALSVRDEIKRVHAGIEGKAAADEIPNQLIGRWKYSPRSGTHFRVFTEKTMIIYRGTTKVGESEYTLASPTKALVGSKKSVHQLREDGRLDIHGDWVGERVEE